MAYGTKYQGDYVDDTGVARRWQILESGYAGAINTSLVESGRGFVSTTWQASEEDEYSPFMPSTTTLRLIDDASNTLYDDLVEALDTLQDKHFQLYLRDMSGGGDGTLDWRGYVRTGSVSAPEDGPRRITIEADDGIGHLKDDLFASTDATVWGKLESLFSGRVTYTSLLQKLLIRNSLGGDYYISCNQYPRLTGTALTANGGAQLADTQNPMDFVYVDLGVYRTIKEGPEGDQFFPIPTYEVLEDVLRTWGCTLFQHGGEWHVIQVNQRGNNTLRRWKYSITDASPVGTPNYSDVTTHVVTVTDEDIKRTPGTLSQMEVYDAAQVQFEFGEYTFMRNPGFDFDPQLGPVVSPTPGPIMVRPKHWTVAFAGSSEYVKDDSGDGQLHTRIVQTYTPGDLPGTAIGTGASSIDTWVKKYSDASTGGAAGNGLIKYAELDTLISGAVSSISIDNTGTFPLESGQKIWVLLNNGTYQEGTLGSNVSARTNGSINVTGISGVASAGNGVYVKATATFNQISMTEIGAGERLNIQAEFLPTYPAGPGSVRPSVGSGDLRTAYIQVKLIGDSTTYYLENDATSGFTWTTSVAWIAHPWTANSWNIVNYVTNEDTPVDGSVQITFGPAVELRGQSNQSFTATRVRWDNVTAIPVLLSPGVVNAKSKTVTVVADTQDTQITNPKGIAVRVGDAPINPAQFGMSLTSNGREDTGDWTEGVVGGSPSGVDHESLIAKMMLRSMRAHRELHSAAYFDLGQAITAWHILSRGGSEYAPRQITQQWDRQVADGTWYKVTETGFTDDAYFIYGNAALVSTRGGVGPTTSGFFTAMGSVLFADGSGAITRTAASISAGVVTSVTTESIVEPIFKAGDLIAIIGPELDYVQARISADQEALATTLSIEDKDNPGTGVTFDNDMGYPAAIYFLEQELLTLARLGEQGFAVTVEGGPLGLVDGAQSGSLSSITVDNWNANLAAGTGVWVDAENLLNVYGDSGKTRGMKRGDTTIYFDDAPITLNLSDNQEILPEGATRRSEFKVTADAITAYIGNPGGVIATVSGTPTFDGTNTSLPVSTTLTDNLVANDPLLVYTAGGSVIKVKVKTSIASGATPIVLSDADGDQTGNISSGDKIAAGSLTGLRIDLDGIEITADTLKSSNYSASSAGWQIDGAGNAEFNNIQARGAIEITGGSGVANLADAGTLAVLDAVDTAQLVAGSVTETIIASDAITTPKIAANAVNASKILAGSITTDKLDANAVTAAKIDVGDLFAQSISLTGSISGTGWSITSTAITMESGSIDLGAFTVSAAGAVTASNIAVTGGSISIGANFGVDASGNLTASNATISGAVTATSGSFTGSITATSGSLASLSVTGALTVGSGGSITTSGPNLSTTLTYNSGLSITGSSTTATYQASFMSLTNTSSGSTSITASASSGGASIAVDGDGNGSVSVDGNVVYHPGNVGGSVTGSRGGNAALASLLSVLDGYGIISDNTTA